jgi:hypothetical protein
VTLDPVTGLLTWTPTEAQGPSTNTLTIALHDNGQPSLGTTNTFTVIVTETNSAPRVSLASEQTIPEHEPLVLTGWALDDDLPTNTLAFTLVSGPTGLTLDAASGRLAWTPTEAQGPSTNSVVVAVLDNGQPSLAVTNSFTVVVTESNSSPSLTVPPNQVVTELVALSLTNTAVDTDIPANTLTFTLVSGPAGLTLDAGSGHLAWTPTEAQGPSTNTVVVAVADHGVPSLAVTNSFTIVVTESNSPPGVDPIPDQNAEVGVELRVGITATDPDLPAQGLRFSLGPGAPTGAAIDAQSGVWTWTPGVGQAATTNLVHVIVTDAGQPSLSGTNTLRVVVAAAPLTEPELVGPTLSTEGFSVRVKTAAGRTYVLEYKRALADPTWSLADSVVGDGAEHVLLDSAPTDPQRFYRVRAQ